MRKGSSSIFTEMTIDLLTSKDSTLIGTIGELIAWRYLRKVTGNFPILFGGGQYFHPQYPSRTGVKYEIIGFSKAQTEFLKNIPRRYDFIVVKRRRIGDGLLGKPEEIYLAEVKATLKGRRHDMKDEARE